MEQTRYTTPAILIHWVMAALIIVAWTIGTLAVDMPLGPDRIVSFSWHKWIGITVLFLVLLRIVWRLTHRVPELNIAIPKWQERTMAFTHWALYILMFSIPVVGWLMSSAHGYTVNYFGLFELPDLVSKDKVLGEQLEDLHALLADGLMILVGLHVLAALKHQFIDKDGLLSRMSFHKSSNKKGAI